MSDDMLAEYESHEQFVEPFSEFGGLMMQSGIPVRIKDSGGQGTFVRVPQPNAADEGEVLTAQADGSVAWSNQNIMTSTVTISNATLKSTNATTLVPAQGVGTVVQVISSAWRLNYGGSNVFTSSPATLFRYNNSFGGQNPTFGNTFWEASQDSVTLRYDPLRENPLIASECENLPVTVRLNSAITGNAANNNTVTVVTKYVVNNLP